MFFLDEAQEVFLNMFLMAIRPVFVGRRNCLSWSDEKKKESEMIKIHVGSDSYSAFISDVWAIVPRFSEMDDFSVVPLRYFMEEDQGQAIIKK